MEETSVEAKTKSGVILLTLSFFSSLTIASYFIYADYFLPWSAGAVVAFYGLFLFIQISQESIAPTEHVNDSPYFLGFILTLVALIISFNKLGASKLTQVADILFIVREFSSALITTVIGIVWRFVLVTTDPVEQKTQEMIQLFQEEFRRNTARFKQAQLELVELVKDFHKYQSRILREQKTISEIYVSSLANSADELRSLQETSSMAIKNNMKTIKYLTGRVEEISTSLSNVINHSKDGEKSIVSLNQNIEEFNSNMTEIVQQSLNLRKILNDEMIPRSESIAKDLGAVDYILTEFVDIAEKKIEDLRRT